MMSGSDRDGFYLTTPIYYVNDVPHIGHAYTTIACDALARWHRMRGDVSRFLTGVDEHGQKIQQAAEKRGMAPIELCDEVVVNFKKLWDVLGISNDDFIRTTEERHIEVVRYFFKTLMDRGDIYKGSYEGWYCVPCETYVPEGQIGTGQACPDCGRPLARMSEESYFFRLSKYQDALIKHYEERPDAIMPRARYNEVMSFIKGGLQDLSVSRTTLKWGIPVPGDERHVVYVWLDALINYISALEYPKPGGLWETHWPNARHMVGKDIIRFHAVIWPAILMAMGANPPVRVFAHGWWTVEGDKMSKSKGNVVDPFEMAELYGVDPFRYFVLREVPFGNDGDFSETALVGRINSDLANDLGNLLHRTLTMIASYSGGAVPSGEPENPLDAEVRALAESTVASVDKAMETFSYDEALKLIWAFIGRGNKYIDETAPWKLHKEGNSRRLNGVLHVLYEVLRLSALLVAPFIPESAGKIWKQLGYAKNAGSPLTENIDAFRWGDGAGVKIGRAEVLFPRIDLEQWKKDRQSKEGTEGTAAPQAVEHEPEIAIENFRAVEMRVARIVKAEEIPKSKKLYKLEIDLGYERRTICAGIKAFFKPEELEGKRVIVVANLKPAKLCGIESNGMILAASRKSGEKGGESEQLALVAPASDIPLGSRVS
jgi:methionyl-tRNA synthetase